MLTMYNSDDRLTHHEWASGDQISNRAIVIKWITFWFRRRQVRGQASVQKLISEHGKLELHTATFVNFTKEESQSVEVYDLQKHISESNLETSKNKWAANDGISHSRKQSTIEENFSKSVTCSKNPNQNLIGEWV